MARYLLKLTKTFEVDTSKWSKEGENYLADGLSEGESRRNPTPAALHDSIREGLADDMESCGVDLGDIDSNDFTIEVLDPTLSTQPTSEPATEVEDESED